MFLENNIRLQVYSLMSPHNYHQGTSRYSRNSSFKLKYKK